MKFTPRQILIGGLVILVICIVYQCGIQKESFTNIPIMTIPQTPKGSSAQLDVLNANWRSILEYLSQNPDKSFTFIADIKDKFFDDSCSIKQPRIDFTNLVNEYRPVFK